jgi:hypothetical protein
MHFDGWSVRKYEKKKRQIPALFLAQDGCIEEQIL